LLVIIAVGVACYFPVYGFTMYGCMWPFIKI